MPESAMSPRVKNYLDLFLGLVILLVTYAISH